MSARYGMFAGKMHNDKEDFYIDIEIVLYYLWFRLDVHRFKNGGKTCWGKHARIHIVRLLPLAFPGHPFKAYTNFSRGKNKMESL